MSALFLLLFSVPCRMFPKVITAWCLELPGLPWPSTGDGDLGLGDLGWEIPEDMDRNLS